MVEAVTQVPRAQVQYINKEVPKYVLQAVEQVVDVPSVLNVEVPVEVPMVMTCEAITQVPVENRQIVPKQIPKVMMEVVNQMQQVPQVLIEEQLDTSAGMRSHPTSPEADGSVNAAADSKGYNPGCGESPSSSCRPHQ